MDDDDEYVKGQEWGKVFVTREEWGAKPARWAKPLEPPIMVFRPSVMGTETCYDKEDCSEILRATQEMNMNVMNLPDIKWNFMISPDGTIYEGRGWRTEGYKSPSMKKEFGSKTVIEFGYIGDFEDVDAVPGEIQLAQQNFVTKAIRNKTAHPRVTVAPLAERNSKR